MGLLDYLLTGKQSSGSLWDSLSSSLTTGIDDNRQMMRMGGLASVLGADPNQVMQSAMLGNGMDDKRRVRTQEQQKKNKTLEWMRSKNPDLAAQVEAGMPVSEAFKVMNQKPQTRRILQGADGFNYFEDGSRVLPNVQRQQKPQYRQVTGQNAQKLGLDPQKSYNVGPDGKISQIGGTGTNVTVNNSGENEYNKTINRHWADENIAIAKKAQAAQSNIGKLQYLGEALKTPDLYTGAGGEAVLKLKNAAAALGMDVDVDALGAGQAVQAIVNRMAMEMRNPENGGGLPGAASDADREFLKQSIPNLTKTPEGNRKLIEYAMRLEERNIEVDQLRRSYVKQYGQLDDRFYDYLAQWSEQNPLFPEAASGEYNSPVASGKTQNGVSWGRVD